MKFKLELSINKSRAEVWKAFDSVETMKKWQPSLVKSELVSGISGQPGAVAKLTYEEGGREFSLIERVTHRDEPSQLDGVYENEFTDNIVRNSFVEKGENETLWILETEFTFKTFLMKIMGPMMKKNFVRRTEQDMARFKEVAENQK